MMAAGAGSLCHPERGRFPAAPQNRESCSREKQHRGALLLRALGALPFVFLAFSTSSPLLPFITKGRVTWVCVLVPCL
jgi:hypothetical protein